jgi:hypothetical protein
MPIRLIGIFNTSVIGCTDPLAEQGIPRTRAGGRRLAGAARPNRGGADQGL